MGTPLLPTFADPKDGVVGPDDMFDDELQRDEAVAEHRGGDDADEYDEESGGLPDQRSPIPGAGPLLEEPRDDRVFKTIDKEVDRQSRAARNRDEEGKHWDRIKDGVQFSILEKSEDQAVFRAVLPPGVEDVPQPIPNKVLDLTNKQVSQILVDPPLPNPKPDGDAEKNRSAMDLAKNFLRTDGDSSGTNDAELYREVLTLNRTRKSAFVYVWVDPTAGGWRPKQKKAHPRATDPKNPLLAPVLDAQGQPVMGADGQPQLERCADPVLRYVAEVEDPATGATVEQFTPHAAEAAREWLPKHRRRVLHPNQVRTVPITATAFEAHSIIVLMWEPLGEAKKRFNALRDLSKQDLKQLCRWKPKRWKSLVPELLRPKNDGLDADGTVTDDTLLFWYMKFCRLSTDYPDGAEIHVTGGSLEGEREGFVLLRDTLREDVETDNGEIVPVLMEPPIAQFRSIIDDAKKGDPFGGTPVSFFGGANEIRAHLYLSVLEDIDVRLHPNTFLTSTSSLTREDLTRRDDTPLDVLTKDDMPTFEQRPAMPAYLPTTLEKIEHDMDVGSNLSQTAQALDSKYSESGRAKEVSISQAKVQLAQEWQGFTNGVMQYWKVKLQLAQARLKTPQLVKVAGQNSAYKSRHFVGADMIGVSAVSLLPGSATMMNPAEKSRYIADGQNNGWLEKPEAGELFRSSMSDDLGLPPDPHEEHIDRCIADWLDGPPDGWEEAFQWNQSLPQRQQQYDQEHQKAVSDLTALFASAPGMDAASAQQMATSQAQEQLGQRPEPKPLYDPFEPRANDEEPIVAQVQYTKLSRLMSTVEFSEQPKSWRSLVERKYDSARHAAGIQFVREQQEAQQNQQQQGAPPEWQEFIQEATKSVVAKARQLLAAEVAAIGSSTTVAEKPKATPVPEMLAEQQAQAADHAHERDMQTLKHEHAMQEIGAKALASAVTKPPTPPAATKPTHTFPPR